MGIKDRVFVLHRGFPLSEVKNVLYYSITIIGNEYLGFGKVSCCDVRCTVYDLYGRSLVWQLLGLAVIYIGVTSPESPLLLTALLLLADTIIGGCKATAPNRQVTAKYKSYTVCHLLAMRKQWKGIMLLTYHLCCCVAGGLIGETMATS